MWFVFLSELWFHNIPLPSADCALKLCYPHFSVGLNDTLTPQVAFTPGTTTADSPRLKSWPETDCFLVKITKESKGQPFHCYSCVTLHAVAIITTPAKDVLFGVKKTSTPDSSVDFSTTSYIFCPTSPCLLGAACFRPVFNCKCDLLWFSKAAHGFFFYSTR